MGIRAWRVLAVDDFFSHGLNIKIDQTVDLTRWRWR